MLNAMRPKPPSACGLLVQEVGNALGGIERKEIVCWDFIGSEQVGEPGETLLDAGMTRDEHCRVRLDVHAHDDEAGSVVIDHRKASWRSGLELIAESRSAESDPRLPNNSGTSLRVGPP